MHCGKVLQDFGIKILNEDHQPKGFFLLIDHNCIFFSFGLITDGSDAEPVNKAIHGDLPRWG